MVMSYLHRRTKSLFIYSILWLRDSVLRLPKIFEKTLNDLTAFVQQDIDAIA